MAVARDDWGDKAYDTVFVQVSEDVSMQPYTTEMKIYPNPVSEILHFSRACDFEIFSLTGHRLLEGRNARKTDVSTLEKGLYLLRTAYGIRKFQII